MIRATAVNRQPKRLIGFSASSTSLVFLSPLFSSFPLPLSPLCGLSFTDF